MYFARALAIWLLIIVAESIHGTIRQLFIARSIGDLPARRIAVPVGASLIFIVTVLFIRWMAALSKRALILIGFIWAALTLAFEVSLGLLLGYSRDRLWEDYDVSRGGLMMFGLLFMIFTPYLAARLRKVV